MPEDRPPACPPKAGRWTPTIIGPANSMIDRDVLAVWGKRSENVYALVSTELDGAFRSFAAFRSLDHGTSWRWEKFGTPAPQPFNKEPPVRAIWGWSDGILVMRDDDLVFSRDGNAGDGATLPRSWTVRSVPKPPWPDFLGAIWGTGPEDVYLGGSSGYILHSSDGGEHWALRHQSKDPWGIRRIWGPDADTIYVVESAELRQPRVRLHRSTDRGRSWTLIPAVGPEGPLMVGNLTGYGQDLFTVDEKRILHSRDAEHWEVVFELAPDTGLNRERFTRIFATRSGEVFAVGTVIVHRGANETEFRREANLGDVFPLTDVWSDDCGEAFAAGSVGRVYHRE